MRVHVIEDGKVINTIEVKSLDFMPNLVDASLGGAIGDIWDGGRFTTPTSQVDEAELIKRYDGIVQSHLDSIARSFGYGDPNRPEVSPILHAISYAEEPAVERFMNEGKALRAWRSMVWVTAAGILNEVKAGTRAIPTEAELLAELPPPPTQDPL